MNCAFQQESKFTLISQCCTFIPWDLFFEGVFATFYMINGGREKIEL
jgi:hypothetical protein